MAICGARRGEKRCLWLHAALRTLLVYSALRGSRSMAVSCKGTKQALIDCLKMSPCMEKGGDFQECLRRPDGGTLLCIC